MSTLKMLEKRRFEELFQMWGGYVMDFSNAEFADAIKDAVGIDIYSERYAAKGDSKAKRLRALWEIEPDPLVGKVLSSLLDVWAYENGEQIKSEPRYQECRNTADRLTEATATENADQQFLRQEFVVPDLDDLQLDREIAAVLEARLVEVERGRAAGMPLAVVMLCGSILEGALLGTALKMPMRFNTAKGSLKDKNGKVRPLHEWPLAQLIDVACEVGLLQPDVRKFGHALRDFRNYIHPHEQRRSGFAPDRHTADICYQVLKAALSGLGNSR